MKRHQRKNNPWGVNRKVWVAIDGGEHEISSTGVRKHLIEDIKIDTTFRNGEKKKNPIHNIEDQSREKKKSDGFFRKAKLIQVWTFAQFEKKEEAKYREEILPISEMSQFSVDGEKNDGKKKKHRA